MNYIGKWEAVFLGTGSSSAVPRIRCKILNPKPTCVCNAQPFDEFNHRLNPSLLIKRRSEEGDYHIIVDFGKTFRESVLNHFEKHNVTSIDTIMITHPHCDAMGGLDDVRDVTDRKPGENASPVKIHVDDITLEKLKETYPYLFPELRTGHGPTAIGTLHPVLMYDCVPFALKDLDVIPIRLHHGKRTTCLGFSFSQSPDTQMVYFSDFRHNGSGETVAHGAQVITQEDYDNFSLFVDPEKALPILKQKRISVLILDCLRMTTCTPVHSVFPETLELIKSFEKIGIIPDKIYFTGMDCSIDYKTLKEEILSRGFTTTEPGYDGLSFKF